MNINVIKRSSPIKKNKNNEMNKGKSEALQNNGRKLKFTTKQIITTVRLIDLGKTQKLSITTRCFFFNILRHFFLSKWNLLDINTSQVVKLYSDVIPHKFHLFDFRRLVNLIRSLDIKLADNRERSFKRTSWLYL